jgi:RND family efflux transporter MFP subunit
VASLIRDRIVDICLCEGKTVAKGDVLVRLDDREVRAQLQELKAREEFAKRELSRVTELLGKGVATTQAFERISTDLRQIQALVSVQLEKLEDYTIAAPMDGVVLRRDGEIGEIAEPGQVLFRVGVPKPLQVVAEVNEEDIPRVIVGQTVLLRTDAFAGRRLEGKVREITPMGDAVARTYRIRIALADDTPLIVGMSVEANVVTREKEQALLIPADAVQGNEVFVLEDGRARRRRIEIGIRGTRSVEVAAGLREGEAVVSPAPGDLADGRRVRVKRAERARP